MLDQLFRLGNIKMCAVDRNWEINNVAYGL